MICRAKGCRERARPKGRFCSPACRTRDWKARTNYQRPEPGPSNGNAAERRYGGLQVAWGPALRVMEDAIVVANDAPVGGIDDEAASRLARRYLARALPARQRQRLESRQ